MPALQIHASSLAPLVDEAAAALQAKVVVWRRDFHQHPELGNREMRTAGIVAAHLRARGFDEGALLPGVRALAHLVCDYLESAA